MTEALSKGQKRRAEIIEVARSVLIEDGYDGFVLRHIAERAGIKLGNLQYYFSTRDDLIEEVARAENHGGLMAIRKLETSSAGPAEKLRQLVHAIVGQWHREGGKVFIVVSLLAVHQPRFRRLHLENYRDFYEAFCDVLSELEPGTRRSVLMRKVRVATALLDGALFQIPLERGRGSKKKLDEFFDELADSMLRLVGHAV
ncbi:MAG: TetR/AcrR family transcriptional regulator [Deltaproteobacteria bacterium]|nr:TetR/AcrR family transcriptional regulator [Deltaproteobacteria bacterium]